MKLTNLEASRRDGRLELILGLDAIYFEAVRFDPDTDAAEVARRLRTLAARIEQLDAAHGVYYCPECGVMEGNWHMPTCSQPRSLVRRPDGVATCRKCGGAMKPGYAIGQTVDCSDEGTCSPAGPGKLIDCMKCEQCGWSVTAGVKVAPATHKPLPLEPTPAMLAAVSSYSKDQIAADAIYRAMVAAAPDGAGGLGDGRNT